MRVTQTKAARLGAVGRQAAGPVSKAEASSGRHARHVGPVESPVRHQRHAIEVGHPREFGRQREVGVGDDHPLDAPEPEVGHPGLHRTVETQVRSPDGVGAGDLGPGLDLLVVAHHCDRQVTGRRQHGGRHAPGEVGALFGAERWGEAQLGLRERLHRDEHRDPHECHGTCC